MYRSFSTFVVADSWSFQNPTFGYTQNVSGKFSATHKQNYKDK